MNWRQLFLSTAKAALATALGAVGFRTTAQAQSPTASGSRTARCCRRRHRRSKASSSRTSSTVSRAGRRRHAARRRAERTPHPDRRCGLRLQLRVRRRRADADLDKLARAGLRYTQMHNTALCSPTRAALLTGRNHHAVGFGTVAEARPAIPATTSITRPETAHGAQGAQGERLLHRLVRQEPQRADLGGEPAGTVHPLAGRPGLRLFLRLRRRRHEPVAAGQPVPQHHADPSLHRQAGVEPQHGDGGRRIEYISTQTSTDPKRPWFIHYAPGATHAPHHPTPEWIKTIRTCISSTTAGTRSASASSRTRRSSASCRRTRSFRPGRTSCPKWETLTADQKKLYLRQINVWAAYMAYSDHEIGRIVETSKT